MEASVTHAPTGCRCTISVTDTDNVLALKTHALEAMFAGSVNAVWEAAVVAARLDGYESEEADELDDAQRIADTRLESGGNVQLVRRWAVVKSPAVYAVSGCRIAVSPCGRLCAAGTYLGSAFVFDTSTAEQVAHVTTGAQFVSCVMFSWCGLWLAMCTYDNSIYVWSTATWECAHVLQGHTSRVFAAAWTHCGHLVSASDDKTVRVWDVSREVCTAVLEGHTDCVRGVVASRTRIFSGSHDRTIRVWDAVNPSHTATLQGHTDYVLHLALTGDGQKLVSCSFDVTMKVWCTSALICLRTLRTEQPMFQVAVSQEGEVVAASGTGHTQLWCLSTGNRVGCIRNPNSINVALSPCGRWVFTLGADRVRVSAVHDVRDDAPRGA